MTAPNMATITELLERSLQNCSLNQNHHQSSSSSSSSSNSGGIGGGIGFGRSSTSGSPKNHNHISNSSDTILELNSQISLPYHWEQCLDLKTGEIYYINWRTGMKAKEDPRKSGDFYGEEDDSSCDSEESSSESSPTSSREDDHHHQNQNQNQNHVLVVAGCKSCLMYFMVTKQDVDCPKCSGQLLHFDQNHASP